MIAKLGLKSLSTIAGILMAAPAGAVSITLDGVLPGTTTATSFSFDTSRAMSFQAHSTTGVAGYQGGGYRSEFEALQPDLAGDVAKQDVLRDSSVSCAQHASFCSTGARGGVMYWSLTPDVGNLDRDGGKITLSWGGTQGLGDGFGDDLALFDWGSPEGFEIRAWDENANGGLGGWSSWASSQAGLITYHSPASRYAGEELNTITTFDFASSTFRVTTDPDYTGFSVTPLVSQIEIRAGLPGQGLIDPQTGLEFASNDYDPDIWYAVGLHDLDLIGSGSGLNAFSSGSPDWLFDSEDYALVSSIFPTVPGGFGADDRVRTMRDASGAPLSAFYDPFSVLGTSEAVPAPAALGLLLAGLGWLRLRRH